MATGSKKRQTLAKLARERAVKERRDRKQAKKDEKKLAELAGAGDELTAGSLSDPAEDALTPIASPS